MLHNVTYNPSVISWVDECAGCFKINNTVQFAASWGRMKSNRWVIENISRISSCQVQKNPLSLLFVRHWQPFWLRQELSKSSFVRFKPAYFVGQTEPKIHFLGGKWSIMFCSRSAEMNYEKMSRAMRYHYGSVRQGRKGHLAMVKEMRLFYRWLGD